MNTKTDKTGVGFFGFKNIIYGLLIFGLILELSGGVSANGCGCISANYTFVCGQTVNESCILNCSLTSAGTCFTIGADNIVIDGNGHNITGNTTGDGIEVSSAWSNVTIKNINIYNFENGIILDGSNSIATNNTIDLNNGYGIRIDWCGCGNFGNDCNNQIINNEISLNLGGVIISGGECPSNNNTITDNTITNNTNNGVYFDSGANNNTLTENLICGNGLDVNDSDAENSGDNNSCNTTYNWNDTSAAGVGCLYQCIVCVDNDSDGYNITGGVCGLIDCDDNNVSVFPGSVHGCKFCNGTTGNLENVVNGTSCEDGPWCNGVETCQAGVCTAGTPPTCNDGAYCNGVETCNETTDSCNAGTPPTCNDGAYCNGVETCNETADSCNAGTQINCSANNISGIATCTYDPDNNSSTWDYFPGFTSVCDEENDMCTIGTINLIHTLNCSLCVCQKQCCCLIGSNSPGHGSSWLPAKLGVAEGCGDSLCGPTENYTNCPGDCPKPIVCGDGTCEGDETCKTCEKDCGACPAKLIINCPENAVAGETITCAVKDENGNPVFGAVVTLSDGRTSITDEEGNARFLAVQSGEIDANAVKESYIESEKVPIYVAKVCWLFDIKFMGICWYWWLLLLLILILLYYLFKKRKKKE